MSGFSWPLFLNEDRAALIHEILRGPHARDFDGFECPSCARLHVRVHSHLLMPFAQRTNLPLIVIIDVAAGWRKWCPAIMSRHTYPLCSACGLHMLPLIVRARALAAAGLIRSHGVSLDHQVTSSEKRDVRWSPAERAQE
jgi:hypothetical protein